MMRTRPELTGSFGAVASTHWLATSSGMAVLERGGNAADAAVAAGLVLQVVEPHLNGPGGDMQLILRAPGGEPQVLCGQGVTPAAATIDRMRAESVAHIPGTGLLPAVVPGAVPAWFTLLREHGTLAPTDVLAFAIELAERGHRAPPRRSHDRRPRRPLPRALAGIRRDLGRPRASGVGDDPQSRARADLSPARRRGPRPEHTPGTCRHADSGQPHHQVPYRSGTSRLHYPSACALGHRRSAPATGTAALGRSSRASTPAAPTAPTEHGSVVPSRGSSRGHEAFCGDDNPRHRGCTASPTGHAARPQPNLRNRP